jgi:hypothetical protein
VASQFSKSVRCCKITFGTRTSTTSHESWSADCSSSGVNVLTSPQLLSGFCEAARRPSMYLTPSTSCFSCASMRCTGDPRLDHFHTMSALCSCDLDNGWDEMDRPYRPAASLVCRLPTAPLPFLSTWMDSSNEGLNKHAGVSDQPTIPIYIGHKGCLWV